MFEDLRYFQNQLRMGDAYCYPEDKLKIEQGLIRVAKVGEQIWKR